VISRVLFAVVITGGDVGVECVREDGVACDPRTLIELNEETLEYVLTDPTIKFVFGTVADTALALSVPGLVDSVYVPVPPVPVPNAVIVVPGATPVAVTTCPVVKVPELTAVTVITFVANDAVPAAVRLCAGPGEISFHV
jgi:hypothetical protein